MLNAETKKELLTIIDEIAGLEKRRNEIRRQEFDLRDRISTIRAKNLVDIAVVKDNKEKPIYPNEQVREAALVVALDKDSEFKTLRDKLRTLENTLQDISIEHIRLSNRKALLMFEAGLVSPSSSSEIAIE
jgi:hypothetical protein